MTCNLCPFIFLVNESRIGAFHPDIRRAWEKSAQVKPRISREILALYYLPTLNLIKPTWTRNEWESLKEILATPTKPKLTQASQLPIFNAAHYLKDLNPTEINQLQTLIEFSPSFPPRKTQKTRRFLHPVGVRPGFPTQIERIFTVSTKIPTVISGGIAKDISRDLSRDITPIKRSTPSTTQPFIESKIIPQLELLVPNWSRPQWDIVTNLVLHPSQSTRGVPLRLINAAFALRGQEANLDLIANLLGIE